MWAYRTVRRPRNFRRVIARTTEEIPDTCIYYFPCMETYKTIGLTLKQPIYKCFLFFWRKRKRRKGLCVNSGSDHSTPLAKRILKDSGCSSDNLRQCWDSMAYTFQTERKTKQIFFVVATSQPSFS